MPLLERHLLFSCPELERSWLWISVSCKDRLSNACQRFRTRRKTTSLGYLL